MATRKQAFAETKGAYEQVLPQPEPDLTPDMIIARAAGMRDMLRAQADEADARGVCSEEVRQAFRNAGFGRIVQPRMFGGYEFDPAVFCKVVMEIARGHPGTGWYFALSSSRPLFLASVFPQDVQRELFLPDGNFSASYRAAPAGQLTRADGGWRVTGKWVFSSGCQGSTHYTAGVIVPQDDGPPKMAIFIVPTEDVIIHDDWGGDRSLGVRASSSNTVELKDVFIADRFFSFDDIMETKPEGSHGLHIHGNPMYHGATGGFLAVDFSSIAVGTARAAIDEYSRIMQTQSVHGRPGVPRITDSDSLRNLGTAIRLANAAEAITLQLAEEYVELGRRQMRTGQIISIKDELRIWSVATQSAFTACEAVDLLYRTSVPTSGLRGNKLERYIADIQMIRVHPGMQPWVDTAIAEMELGLPSTRFG